jgi:hypothetical protein
MKLSEDYLELHPRIPQQTDIYHSATTFMREEVLGTYPEIKSYRSLWYSIPGEANGVKGSFSVGVNPWTRTIYHEGFIPAKY